MNGKWFRKGGALRPGGRYGVGYGVLLRLRKSGESLISGTGRKRLKTMAGPLRESDAYRAQFERDTVVPVRSGAGDGVPFPTGEGAALTA